MELEGIDVGAVAQSTVDSVSQYVGFLIWGLVICSLIAIFVYILSFRHTVTIRHLTKATNTMPMKDRAREINVDGAVFWKLLKRKHIIPVPPASALVLKSASGKPKFHADFTYSEENGYIPLEYDINTQNFDQKLVMTQHGRVVKEAFQPFTSNQRSLYVMQVRKAEQMRKKDILERLTQLATPLVLAMLFIAVLVFWEDVAKPGREMADLNIQMQQKNVVLLEQLSEISAQNARIVQAYTGQDLQINQQVTGQ